MQYVRAKLSHTEWSVRAERPTRHTTLRAADVTNVLVIVAVTPFTTVTMVCVIPPLTGNYLNLFKLMSHIPIRET